jgi:hypothetical protein
MVVRLQTAEGKIKEYRTAYFAGGRGEDGPEKYLTKCGKEWKRAPKPHEECNHLDCAIYLAKSKRDNAPVVFMILIAFSLVAFLLMVLMPDYRSFLMSGNRGALLGDLMIAISIIGPFYFLIDGLRAGNRFNELNEYNLKGTINGIRAWRIFED